HLRSTYANLTAFVRRHHARTCFEIDNFDLRFRRRNADGKDLALSAYRIVSIRRPFGHADALVNRTACNFLPVRQEVFREWRGAGAADLEARQIRVLHTLGSEDPDIYRGRTTRKQSDLVLRKLP